MSWRYCVVLVAYHTEFYNILTQTIPKHDKQDITTILNMRNKIASYKDKEPNKVYEDANEWCTMSGNPCTGKEHAYIYIYFTLLCIVQT